MVSVFIIKYADTFCYNYVAPPGPNIQIIVPVIVGVLLLVAATVVIAIIVLLVIVRKRNRKDSMVKVSVHVKH